MSPPRAATEHVVIVGAGPAGWAAAERLREKAFRGAITIVGDEPHRPYNRTPLSKRLLTGEYAIRDLALPTWTEPDARWLTNTTAAALDTDARTVHLSDGTALRYDGLVLATGVAARELPGAPSHRDRIHMLRTIDDAVRIDRAFGHARNGVTIVGGGFIGCEIASTARARGLRATIIDVAATLMQGALSTPLGAVVADIHRDNGVALHLGVAAIVGWEASGGGVRLLLADGEVINNDTVVVGIGTAPNTGWLAGSGLDITDGVLADATCHAVGAQDIVVAGDVSRWPNLAFDGIPRRVEHWINAIEMGQAAAESLLAGRGSAQPFTPIPRFWSEQHGVKIQALGVPHLGQELRIIEGSLGRGPFLAAFTQPPAPGQHGHRLMGLIGFDASRRMLDHAGLIGQQISCAPTFIAQPLGAAAPHPGPHRTTLT